MFYEYATNLISLIEILFANLSLVLIILGKRMVIFVSEKTSHLNHEFYGTDTEIHLIYVHLVVFFHVYGVAIRKYEKRLAVDCL